jgi:hypothetical protein
LPADQFELECSGVDVAALRRFVTTSPAGPVHVRLGGAPGSRPRRGRVVDAAGALVRGPLPIDVLGSGGGSELLRTWTTVDGSFTLSLPPPPWHARVALENELPFAPLVDGAGDELRVLLPGHRVLCRLVAASPSAQVRSAETCAYLDLGARRRAHGTLFGWQGDWWLQWVGLAPGNYTLRADRAPVRLPELEAGVPLALLSGAPLLQLDVTVH